MVTLIRTIAFALVRVHLGRFGFFRGPVGLISWILLVPQCVDHWHEARAFWSYF